MSGSVKIEGTHVLSGVAARRCSQLHGHIPTWNHPSCDQCMKFVVAVDREVEAQIKAESELFPVELDLALVDIDEVAVDLAVWGGVVTLTVAEWREANKRVRAETRSSQLAYEFLCKRVTVLCSLGNQLSAGLMLTVLRQRSLSDQVITDRAAAELASHRILKFSTGIKCRRSAPRSLSHARILQTV